MKITTKQPEVRPNVVLEMTPQEFEVLVSICGNIAGDPEGPRGFVSKIFRYGYDNGYHKRGWVTEKGLTLKDTWD